MSEGAVPSRGQARHRHQSEDPDADLIPADRACQRDLAMRASALLMIICWRLEHHSRSRRAKRAAAKRSERSASGVRRCRESVVGSALCVFVQLSRTPYACNRHHGSSTRTGSYRRYWTCRDGAESVSATPQKHPGAPTSPPRRLCRT